MSLLTRATQIHKRRGAAFLAVAFSVGLAVAVLASPSALADPGAIRDKQAEAQRVLAEINALDSHLGRAVEAYNGARVKLDGIRQSITLNQRDLAVARGNVRRAQRTLANRLVGLYTSGGGSTSSLEVLLGSRSLNDAIGRFDAAQRVAAQDALIMTQVRHFKKTVTTRERRLEHDRAAQAEAVAALDAQRQAIEGQLAERQRLLSSVKSEIVKLQAEERARQAELRRQAQARLAAQEAAARAALRNTVVGPSVVTPEDTTIAPPSHYGGVVGIAMQYLGTPYVWGGASPGGFDCSGLAMYVYAQVGVSLPHYTGSQYQMGVAVSRDQLQPGDLVFFDGLGHEGIYIGGGQFIHAPHTGDVVKISSLSDPWYASTYVGARRIL